MLIIIQTIPLGYYECTETNSCPEGSSYLIPELRKCVPKCKDSGYEWTYAGKCYKNCTAANAEVDPLGEKTCKDKSGVNDPRCAVSYESFVSDKFINAEGNLLMLKVSKQKQKLMLKILPIL